MSKLQPVMNERTTLFVSHRVSTLRYADEIIVLTKNKDRLGEISTKNIFNKGENDSWSSPGKEMNKKELRNQIADLL